MQSSTSPLVKQGGLECCHRLGAISVAPDPGDANERKTAAGRKPASHILMFKLLTLQRWHNLSGERLQLQATDRLSFMRFLELDLAATSGYRDRAPRRRNTAAPAATRQNPAAR